MGLRSASRASGNAYYINNQAGSNCSDDGAHSMARPWCSFAPANRIRTFLPGDQILLARGGAWNQELSLTGRGTASEPITLSAYGTGAKPKILRSQAVGDIGVLLTDANFWKVSDLEVGKASVGILFHYTQLFNNGITISNIDAHDNGGIWGGYSTAYPVSRHVQDPFALSLNINLSSGILFNVASYVSDGHNAFQDVVLNGLILSGDGANASKTYRAAGLGCSDSLRLLGMTNVTVLNSVLFEEAACHTPTGTAAVILGRISQVRFVNNIIFGVPATDSPDQTGIDFEWSEDHVSLQSNFFAANAGPAVEILNIHGGDHSSDLEVEGNTFAQNAHSRQPGAASVWEDNKGRGYASPVGKIHNNLYFEQHGKFLGGKSIGSIADVNNLQTTTTPNYAAEQFSTTQGKNQWRYVYESSQATWAEMPHYSASDNNGAWETSPAQFVNAFNMAPGNCTGSCDGSGVARVWVATNPGTISIRGHALNPSGQGGEMTLSVNLVSGRNVTQIWPSQGGRQLIAGTDHVGYATNVDNVEVAAGDSIRFEVHASGETSNGLLSWTPSVGYVADKTGGNKLLPNMIARR
jgi:hypothetical protein